MDNRLRFLYCSMAELWGHGQWDGCREWEDRRKRGTGGGGKAAPQREGVTRTEKE